MLKGCLILNSNDRFYERTRKFTRSSVDKLAPTLPLPRYLDHKG